MKTSFLYWLNVDHVYGSLFSEVILLNVTCIGSILHYRKPLQSINSFNSSIYAVKPQYNFPLFWLLHITFNCFNSTPFTLNEFNTKTESPFHTVPRNWSPGYKRLCVLGIFVVVKKTWQFKLGIMIFNLFVSRLTHPTWEAFISNTCCQVVLLP